MQKIEEIYKEHVKTVYKYIFCLCQDEEMAEEIVQETFAIAIKELKKFRGDCKLSVWLCQIAKHLWYKELKKMKKHVTISIEELENTPILDEADESILKTEERIQLFKNMQKLDEKTKEVMYLRTMGNLTFSEIAEVLNKTSNWARVTFYRGKEKIKEERKNGEKE